jgi:chromosome segregation protein
MGLESRVFVDGKEFRTLWQSFCDAYERSGQGPAKLEVWCNFVNRRVPNLAARLLDLIKESASKTVELETQLDSIRTSLREKETSITGLELKFAHAAEVLATERSNNTERVGRLEHASDELRRTVENERLRSAEMSLELRNKESELIRSQEQANSLQQTIQRLTDQLSAESTKVSEHKERMRNITHQLTTTKQSLQTSSAERQEVQKTLQERDQELALVREELRTARAAAAHHEESGSKSATQFESEKAELLRAHSKKLEQVERKLASEMDKNETLESNNTQLKKTRKDLEKRNDMVKKICLAFLAFIFLWLYSLAG